MSLRYSLLILLFLFAFIPLTVGGFFTYQEAREELVDQITTKLEAIAQVQEDRIKGVISSYVKDIKLIASRSQLRESVAAYEKTSDIHNLESIQESIDEAKASAPSIESISVYDTRGSRIATTHAKGDAHTAGGEKYIEQATFELKELFVDESNILRVRLLGPILLEGKVQGVVEVIESADPIMAVTEDYTGLGETGEVTLAHRNKAGDALFLTPLRFDAGASFRRVVSKDKTNSPTTQSLGGNRRILTAGDILDYRDTPVFASTRFIDSVGWELVVKIDRSEVLAPANALLTTFLIILSVTVLIASAIAFPLSRIITVPLIQLAHFAENIANRKFTTTTTTTTTTKRKDEIGMLTRAFNTMTVKLGESYAGLEEKVKERTEAMTEAQELAHIGSWEWDTVNNTVIWSDELYRLFGVAQGVKLTFESYLLYVYPEDQEIAQKTVAESMKTHEPFEFDHRAKLQDGTIRWIRGKGRVITDTSGKPIKMVGTAQDITKEKQVDRAKSEFVSLASHQLRTPATSIRWFAEMLLEKEVGTLNKKQKEYVAEIYASDKRMIDLINSLLSVSRIEMGTFTLEPKETDIAKVLHDILAEVSVLIKNKIIAITCAAKSLIVETDPSSLRIVLQNLIVNAVEYTPQSGKVSISCVREDGTIRITVSDTGCGIPKSVHEHMFGKFFRADNARLVKPDGNGLGLYITKSLVAALGGTIGFTSEERKGAVFTVSLPMRQIKKSG